MRALSIRPPWAHAIAHLGKRCENRGWATRYRGPILIHASSTIRLADFRQLERIVGYEVDRDSCERGAIIAVAQLVDCIPVDRVADSPWATGPVAWILDDVRLLAKPIRLRGKLGLWTPSANAISRCRAQTA